MRDQHGIEDVAIDTVHSEANAIDTDRAFTRNEARNLARHADAQDAVGKTQDLAPPVDMAGDQMAAERRPERERFLEVHAAAGAVEPGGDAASFHRDISGEPAARKRRGREANPLDANRVADGDARRNETAAIDLHAGEAHDLADRPPDSPAHRPAVTAIA